MELLNTVRRITRHPLNERHKLTAFLNYVKWQFGSRLLPGEVAFPWVNDSKLLVRRGEHAATGNVYCGLMEFQEMAYLLHVSRPDDLFLDVGANVGAYTILACGVQGARGCAFEPVPSTFQKLHRNIRFNGLDRIVACHNVGVGDCNTTLRFTMCEDSMNHVALGTELTGDTIEVPVNTLDDVLRDESPTIMKIDVEGYELPVVRGSTALLAKPSMNSIIVELNGEGTRYGYGNAETIAAIEDYGFRACKYDPFSRELVEAKDKVMPSGNALFVRDYESVLKRLKEAPSVAVHGTRI